MRVYLDSSAVIKRVIGEAESSALVEAIDGYVHDGALLVSSALAWIEVERALRTRRRGTSGAVAADVDAALSGVAEHMLSTEVVSLARRVSPDVLRSPDAIHLASALLLDADLVVTYDDRLATACAENGLAVARPRSPLVT